jgi:hypothetical protein
VGEVTPERAARVAETEREITDRFIAYGIAEPEAKATAMVRWLQRTGWRVHPELTRSIPVLRRADPVVQAQIVADTKRQLAQQKRARLEQAAHASQQVESCGAEHHPDEATTVYCRQPAGHDGQHRSVDGQDVW